MPKREPQLLGTDAARLRLQGQPSCEHLPIVVLVLDVVLELLARRGEERVLERVGAVPASERVRVSSASSRPRSRMPTRSASASASAMSWVQSRMVASCRSRISRMNDCTSRLERGSRPVVGSSSSSSTGLVSSARASATFCCMPRDRFSMGSLRRSAGKPTRPRMAGIEIARLRRRSCRRSATRSRRFSAADIFLKNDASTETAVDEPAHGLGVALDVVAEDAGRTRRPRGAASRARRTSVDLPEPF